MVVACSRQSDLCSAITRDMRLLVICFIFAVQSARGTIDLQGITDTVQTLKDNAASNFQEFVESIDFDKVKKLDVLDILPKVQHKVEFGKKLYEQKKQFKQILWDYKKQKFNDKLNSLQKFAQLKQQALQNLVEQKKTLAQNLLEKKQKVVQALVEEKQKFVHDLIDHKHQTYNKLFGPPPKKIIYADHPLSHHFEHIDHHPVHYEHAPIYHIAEHAPIHHFEPLSHHFDHHPHKIVKIIEPRPIKKVIIRTKIYD